VRAFGAGAEEIPAADWAKAVEAIAHVLCRAPERRAA
jgi:hypothetical protein